MCICVCFVPADVDRLCGKHRADHLLKNIIPYFALLTHTVFAFPVKLSLRVPISFLTFTHLPFQFSPPAHREGTEQATLWLNLRIQ